jgi:hypothetical protein
MSKYVISHGKTNTAILADPEYSIAQRRGLIYAPFSVCCMYKNRQSQ